MQIFYLSTVAAFGLIVGSFLNALIYRMHTGEGIVRERSHCPNCNKILTWYELIPVFSFLIQKGKCRGCGKRISLQYPLVEIATALLFVLVISNFQFFLSAEALAQAGIFNEFSIVQFLSIFFLLFIISGLIAIFVYDLKHFLIPDRVLVPLVLGTVFAIFFEIWTFGNWDLFGNWKLEIGNLEGAVSALIIALISATPFALLHFLSGGKAMGFGDVKLAFFMGLFLGYPAVLTAMFIAFLLGAIIGIGLIAGGKSTMKSKVPFGPFLIIGTVCALFWGDYLLSRYLNLFYI